MWLVAPYDEAWNHVGHVFYILSVGRENILQIAGLVEAPNGDDDASEDGGKGAGEELATSDGYPWLVQRLSGATSTRSPAQPEDCQPDAKEKQEVTE